MSNNFLYFIGIDVAKDKVDVFSTQTSTHFTVKNSRKDIREALYHFDRENTLVILENTGGYENICISTLEKIGYKIHRANNNRVKSLIKARGINAKTDKLDAKGLALFGQFFHQELEIYQIDEHHQKVRETSFLIENVKKIRASLKNRLKSPNCEHVKHSLKRMIDFLNDEIEQLEKMAANEICQNPEMQATINLIKQYKGVGQDTARNLVAFLPELGKRSARSISSLAGLAPHPKDSGNTKKRRTTLGGRPMVKKTLFMAILSASRYDKRLGDFYQKKLKEGKHKMVALTACMRKMLIDLNAICKRGSME